MLLHGHGALLPVERVQCGSASLHTPTMYDGHARRSDPTSVLTTQQLSSTRMAYPLICWQTRDLLSLRKPQ